MLQEAMPVPGGVEGRPLLRRSSASLLDGNSEGQDGVVLDYGGNEMCLGKFGACFTPPEYVLPVRSHGIHSRFHLAQAECGANRTTYLLSFWRLLPSQVEKPLRSHDSETDVFMSAIRSFVRATG